MTNIIRVMMNKAEKLGKEKMTEFWTDIIIGGY